MDNLVTENIRGLKIKYHTKPGIFSWKGVDNGSKLLIDHLEVDDGTMIADLGAGAGVLGLVLANLNKSGHVHLLEDHLRSYELAKKNTQESGLKNIEVYLSDLFSAVSERTYHQIFSNPPAQMGNDFLEEVVKECFHHLKPGGSVWLVVPLNLKKVMERFLEKQFGSCKMVAQGREHIVLSAKKA